MSPLDRFNATGQVPTKWERISEILNILSADHPAGSAGEAHAMIHSAFSEVESPLAVHPDIDQPMMVNPFENMTTFDYKGKTVYYEVYEGDMLLIGDNGSVEIRSTATKMPNASDDHPYAEYKLLFEKPGADGRKLWDVPSER